ARQSKKEISAGRVTFDKDKVVYIGEATEGEARAAGEVLKAETFFQNIGFTVWLSKDRDGTSMKFILNEGYWDMPDKVAIVTNIVRKAAPVVGGLPIKCVLMNSHLEIQREVVVR